MDWNFFLKIFDDVEVFFEFRMIYFGGIGELMVYLCFMDMVREVKRCGFVFGISINGIFFIDEMMREFVKFGVDLIYFFMDMVLIV